jgi:hypothetical protein
VNQVSVDMAAARRALNNAQMRTELNRIGRAGVRYGRSIAPDAPPLRRGYIRGFFWQIQVDAAGVPRLSIGNRNWKTLWIEHGTAPHPTHPRGRTGTGPVIHSPAHHVFDRILDHLRTTI